MRTGTLSILGMYNYDSTVMDGFTVPEGMNKQDVMNLLFAECAELELLYPAPTTMKQLIPSWCRSMMYRWNTLWKSTQFEYNPIENYDRNEEFTETHDITRESKDNGSQSLNASYENEDGYMNRGNQTTVHSESAYNLSSVTENMQDVLSLNDGRDSSGSGSNTTSVTNSNTQNGTEDGTNTRKGRAHGNIGVTTTQQMIAQERAVAEFNVAWCIVDDFKRMFCVMVY